MFVLENPCNVYERRSAEEQKQIKISTTTCGFFGPQLQQMFWSEGMFPVKLQTKVRSKQDTSFEEETTFSLPEMWQCHLEVLSWYHALIGIQEEEEMSS